MPVASDLEARFAKELGSLSGADDRSVALAVSGGGDSIALMHLAARSLPADYLRVFTIDHGLRPDATAEIALVADQSKALGLHHSVAKWQWDQRGNLQASARAGRWTALVDLARAQGVGTILMGHTQDDQVETALMRLARGSGVDGLTGISGSAMRDGVTLLRPMLDISRAALRDWLHQNRIAWCEDPSNDDTRYDRVRARQMFAHLEDLGLTRKRVLQTVNHMRAAQHSLQQAAATFAAQHVRQQDGDLLLAPAALDLRHADVPRRVLAAAFGWISGETYRPRFDQLIQVAAAAQAGETATLGGCLIATDKSGQVRMTREAAATTPIVLAADTDHMIWDQRWQLNGPFRAGMTVKALADGITSCPDWRKAQIPRISLLASPSVWDGDRLVAAPAANFAQGWTAQIVADFHSAAFAIED